MDRNAKLEWRDELVVDLNRSGSVFAAQYSKMTVEDLSTLRRELKKVDAEFRVVKNTVMRKALNARPEEKFGALLKGQIGVVFAFGDAAGAAKALTEGAKKCEKLKVIGGFLDATVLTAADVDALGSLPSREVLLSKIVGSLVAPHKGLLGVLNGLPRAIVCILNQIKETKTA